MEYNAFQITFRTNLQQIYKQTNPMNSTTPVQFYEKIEYLHQKLDHLHSKSKKSQQFQLRMSFIQYVDKAIEQISKLDKTQPQHQNLQKKYKEYYSAQQNQLQKQKIQKEKQLLALKLKNLNQKQIEVQNGELCLQIQSLKINKEKLSREYGKQQIQMKQQIFQLQKKIKSFQKQFQRVTKLNSAQAKEIEHVKQERNRAEKCHLQIKQQYQNQCGNMELFKTKKNKYLYRNEQGLRNYRNFTNICPDKKGCERLVVVDLPIKFHVLKIVYGIKVGTLLPNRQVQYFNEIGLFEKEDLQIRTQQGALEIEYLKRKHKIRLQKYKLNNKKQLVIMLFGKGDSINVDESN